MKTLKHYPIMSAMKAYKKKARMRFHMPGHKGDKIGFLKAGEYDFTEVDNLDNFHLPTGIIFESQKLAAEKFGAKKTFYVTCGTSMSLLSIVHAFKNRKIAILRESHVKTFDAFENLNVEPVIICGDKNDKATYEKYIDDADVFLLTSPDYYGCCIDSEILRYLKDKGKVVVLDSAHGAHFFKVNSLADKKRYADIVLDGGHKTLKVFTQGAYINVMNEEYLNKIEKSLLAFHTTSPSYLIMASLEYGALYDEYDYDRFFMNIEKMKNSLRAYGIDFLDNDDISRLVVDMRKLEISGNSIEKFLKEKGIFIEFSNANFAVLILTPNDNLCILEKVLKKTAKFAKKDYKKMEFKKLSHKREKGFLEVASLDFEDVDLKEAEGRILRYDLSIYPPATPVVLRGEVIEKADIENIIAAGYDKVINLKCGKVSVIKQ